MDKEANRRFSRAFATAMHSFHFLAAKVMKSGTVPLAQYRLLMLLRESGPLTISDLSSYLGTAQSTASELAGRALESGMVERAADPLDGRRTLYSLSRTGPAALEKPQARHGKNLFESP